MLFGAGLEFGSGRLFFVLIKAKKKPNKTKTEPGEVSLLVMFSRCLVGLLFLVGEISTMCMGFIFAYLVSTSKVRGRQYL